MNPIYCFINTCVTKSVGIGHVNLGYLRFSYTPLLRWRQSADWYHGDRRIQRNVDMSGHNWTPCRSAGTLLSYHRYRGTAYHLSVGPLTASYVVDREGYGPIGPVWPRDARKRSAVAA